MYDERFGLKSNPFRSNAEGASVFVGPSQAKVISRIHKALSAPDNIVTVSGPAGVGKTTIVTRALETNKQNQLVAWIGRMRLAADEVMQLLLAGFGITRQVPGTVRQFAVFQRLLSERAAADTRVVIVIEDALRIGTEALLELEAITATDTGNVGGANIILMGPPEIDKRLMFPELARLKQRSRMGQKIVPLTAAEVQGYLKHCLRAAGKEYSDLFDDDVASMLYRLSEGIPRVMNNICDATLTEAAEENHDRITRELLLAVAADVYGLEPMLDEPSSVADVEMPAPVAEKVVDIEPEPEPEPVPVSAFDPEPAPVSVSKIDPEPEQEFQLTTDDTASMPALELPPIVAAALAEEQEENSAKPALINITGLQPQLETEDLPVEDALIGAADPSAESLKPESFNDTADDLPMLSNSMRIDGPITPAPISAEGEIAEGVANPQPAKKPTMPDLDALEAAITAARGGEHLVDKTDTHLPELHFEPVEPEIEPEPEPKLEFEPIPEPRPEPVFEDKPAAEEAEPPQITLDNSTDQSLEDQRIEGEKLDKMTAELAAVNSLEDISDIMAETLFGIEFEHIAQEALKNPPAAGTLPGDTDVLPSDVLTSSTTPANDPGEDPSPVMLDPKSQEQDKSPTVSVPAINMHPPDQESAAQVSEPSVDPDSIENQFQTEITQTMKTIDPANLPNPELDGDAEKPAGLLGRWKKTFRG